MEEKAAKKKPWIRSIFKLHYVPDRAFRYFLVPENDHWWYVVEKQIVFVGFRNCEVSSGRYVNLSWTFFLRISFDRKFERSSDFPWYGDQDKRGDTSKDLFSSALLRIRKPSFFVCDIINRASLASLEQWKRVTSLLLKRLHKKGTTHGQVSILSWLSLLTALAR